MSEFNDYKWYNENENTSNINAQPFYTETVTAKKKKGRGKFIAIVAVVAVAALSLGVLGGSFIGSSSLAEKTKTIITGDGFKTDPNASFSFQKLTDGERTPLTTVEIANNVGPAVVGISTTTQYRSFFGEIFEQTGSGSGIIISQDGYIVTNNHVIENARSVSVILNTGVEYSATLVGSDAKTDLAVLKIAATDLPAATLGDSSLCQAGELAVAIGNPLGQELAGTVTVGVISAVNRSIQISDDGATMSLLQTDAAINPGNSGGALVNSYGEVIGINSMKFSGENLEGIGFAIPINDAKPVISDLISAGYVKGRPLIGISVRQISSEVAAINDLPAGLNVVEVARGGAAEKAGIKKGDVIVAVDGKLVDTQKEINEIRDTHQAGDTIKIEVSRDGESIVFDVVLQEDTTSRTAN